MGVEDCEKAGSLGSDTMYPILDRLTEKQLEWVEFPCLAAPLSETHFWPAS